MAELKRPMDGLEASFGKANHTLARGQTSGAVTMKLNRFYRDELSFLRLQGREFAEAHPQLTRFLSEQSTDPDVERLLEGFAFLTGKLREKVEDEF
ncbi:MAG: type VI secretion system baseplate subunit TssF, partial [Pseudomonadota bacterium]|nr:type VI secretion system baseplate subunit TssF [Pseudomonadota bacterium]